MAETFPLPIQWRNAFAGLLLLILCPALAVATVQDNFDQNDALALTNNGVILPLEHIVAYVQQHHEGKLIEASLQKQGHRYIYRLELLDSKGRVWDIITDATTGQYLETDTDG